jgi:hypothetical protein
MDESGFEQFATWLPHRVSLPPGPLFCVIDGPTRGRRRAATTARADPCWLLVDTVRRRLTWHHIDAGRIDAGASDRRAARQKAHVQ